MAEFEVVDYQFHIKIRLYIFPNYYIIYVNLFSLSLLFMNIVKFLASFNTVNTYLLLAIFILCIICGYFYFNP